MTWNIELTGEAHEVRRHFIAQAAQQRCEDPEERIKGMVTEVINKALFVMPPDMPVHVRAYGSQSQSDPLHHVNNLRVEIDPFWNFLRNPLPKDEPETAK